VGVGRVCGSSPGAAGITGDDVVSLSQAETSAEVVLVDSLEDFAGFEKLGTNSPCGRRTPTSRTPGCALGAAPSETRGGQSPSCVRGSDGEVQAVTVAGALCSACAASTGVALAATVVLLAWPRPFGRAVRAGRSGRRIHRAARARRGGVRPAQRSGPSPSLRHVRRPCPLAAESSGRFRRPRSVSRAHAAEPAVLEVRRDVCHQLFDVPGRTARVIPPKCVICDDPIEAICLQLVQARAEWHQLDGHVRRGRRNVHASAGPERAHSSANGRTVTPRSIPHDCPSPASGP
jgi:hypothetical protein